MEESTDYFTTDITTEMSPDEVAEMLREILSILRPLEPFLAQLPELMTKIDPLMEGLKTSPVLKMLGVRIP